MVSVTSWTGSTWETGHTLREPVALYTGKWPEWISLQETKKAGNLQSPHSLQAPKCLLGTWCALGITAALARAQVQQDGSPRKRLCREPGAEGLHAWPPPYSVGQTPMRRRTWVLADMRLPLGCALNPQMVSALEPNLQHLQGVPVFVECVKTCLQRIMEQGSCPFHGSQSAGAAAPVTQSPLRKTDAASLALLEKCGFQRL
ncbi:uncharacterized protein LOC111186373 [Delphinapterus leucas]|uniref:Uncharacterized protein LOC111186373 n=1 Tax=Delphinapterus leucas TaxID=9749 RepID=A0A2Y9Q0J8_DELLE|nr:uncharacterized protein LOC111186373 [Delphinapterus leucas]